MTAPTRPRPRARAIRLAAAGIALTATLAACGSSSAKPSATTTKGSATTAKGDASATTAAAGTATTAASGGGPAASGNFCTDVKTFKAEFDKASGPDDNNTDFKAAFTTIHDMMGSLVGEAPSEIKADLELFKKTFDTAYDALAKVDFDVTKVPSDPAATKAFSDLSGEEMSAANKRITDYLAKECGIVDKTDESAVPNDSSATDDSSATSDSSAGDDSGSGDGSSSASADLCAAVTADEVSTAVGGKVTAGTDSGGSGLCIFDDTTGDGSHQTQFSLNGEFQSADKVKTVFPDVKVVEGIGTDAYTTTGQLHMKWGTQDIAIIVGPMLGSGADNSDKEIALAKLIWSKLPKD